MAFSDGVDHGTVEAELRHVGLPRPDVGTELERKLTETLRSELNLTVTSMSLRRRALAEGNGWDEATDTRAGWLPEGPLDPPKGMS